MQRIKLEKTTLEENVYTRDTKQYRVKDLIEISQGLEPFDLPIIGIDLSINPWSTSLSAFLDFCKHMNRIKDADYSFPIILDNTGFICDGWHRLAKAILDGKKTIKAVRLTTMPEPL